MAWQRKLLDHQPAEIKGLLWVGLSATKIAEMYGVSAVFVSGIRKGTSYKGVAWPDGSVGGLSWARKQALIAERQSAQALSEAGSAVIPPAGADAIGGLAHREDMERYERLKQQGLVVAAADDRTGPLVSEQEALFLVAKALREGAAEKLREAALRGESAAEAVVVEQPERPSNFAEADAGLDERLDAREDPEVLEARERPWDYVPPAVAGRK